MPDSSNTEDTILNKLVGLLAENGNVPRDVKDRLTIEALAEVIRLLRPLQKLEDRVEALEKKNLITIYEKHPKMAIAIIFALFVILNYAAHAVTPDQWFGALAKALGIP